MIVPPDPHLTDRLAVIQSRISAAAKNAGRLSSEIRLLAATKTVPASTILDAARLGIADVGENRVQEASEKRLDLAGASLTHHLIGQLQTNKARRAVELFDVIQSVDRLRVAESVSKAAVELGKRPRCLIELKISDDASKAGVALPDADALLDSIERLPGLVLSGVMAIAPLDASDAETARAFSRAKDFFEKHRSRFGAAPVLSMGMSDDLEIAVAQGSTMVRVGRALFGERKTTNA